MVASASLQTLMVKYLQKEHPEKKRVNDEIGNGRLLLEEFEGIDLRLTFVSTRAIHRYAANLSNLPCARFKDHSFPRLAVHHHE
jgi:hypothetical protein